MIDEILPKKKKIDEISDSINCWGFLMENFHLKSPQKYSVKIYFARNYLAALYHDFQPKIRQKLIHKIKKWEFTYILIFAHAKKLQTNKRTST